MLGHNEGGYIGTIVAGQIDIKEFKVLASSQTPLDKALIKQINHIKSVRRSNIKTEKSDELFSNIFS